MERRPQAVHLRGDAGDVSRPASTPPGGAGPPGQHTSRRPTSRPPSATHTRAQIRRCRHLQRAQAEAAAAPPVGVRAADGAERAGALQLRLAPRQDLRRLAAERPRRPGARWRVGRGEARAHGADGRAGVRRGGCRLARLGAVRPPAVLLLDAPERGSPRASV